MVILSEPADAPMVTSKTLQERNADGSPKSRHRSWKPHPIQGWSTDFIPKLTGDALELDFVDQVVIISAPVAMQCRRQLAQKEGIFVGVTAAATFAAPLAVRNRAASATPILALLPDPRDRYPRTPLFGA